MLSMVKTIGYDFIDNVVFVAVNINNDVAIIVDVL